MIDQPGQIESDIDALISAPEYVRLTQIRPEFDLFDFLESLSENASSRALAFLLDSSREHELGTAFFDAFIQQVHRAGKGQTHRLSLRQSLALQGAFTSVTCEWVTSQGRRLDLLIKVFDHARNLVAVVGIENKHWADELDDQVAHYQQELVTQFPAVHARVVLFLAPQARPSSTADLTCACPHVPCSYQAVVKALAEVENRVSEEIRLFISSLKNHLGKTLEGSTTMHAQIKELVRVLYQNSQHRQAIRHILEHLPRLGTLVPDIFAAVEEHLRKTYPDEPFEPETYPARQLHRLQEMYIIPARLRALTKPVDGFRFLYVLRAIQNGPDIPDLGDRVMVQLMAYNETSGFGGKVDALELPKHLPPSQSTPYGWYYSWKSVWAGAEHQLADLDKQDVQQCAKLFIQAIDATFPKLREIVQAAYPSPGEGD